MGIKVPEPINITPGIYHNPKLGLISISSDGTSWKTLADKNLGATRIYNPGDTLDESNCGGYFQRGNCYMFPWDGNISVTTSTSTVNTSAYGAGVFYTDSTFRPLGNSNWSNPKNTDLWGGDTGTYVSQKGPCPEGFHIPRVNEYEWIINRINELGLNPGRTIYEFLRTPFAGYRGISNGNVGGQGTDGSYWTCRCPGSYAPVAFKLSTAFQTSLTNNKRCAGLVIRPFKDDPVVPILSIPISDRIRLG